AAQRRKRRAEARELEEEHVHDVARPEREASETQIGTTSGRDNGVAAGEGLGARQGRQYGGKKEAESEWAHGELLRGGAAGGWQRLHRSASLSWHSARRARAARGVSSSRSRPRKASASAAR